MAKDLSGAQVGTAPSVGVNNPRPETLRGRNEFPQSFLHLTTDRYGYCNPFFWAKCERGDVQNLHTEHDLHTFTMASPMVSEVNMHKTFVKIPMQAIYPRNWERMMTIPTQGDDVPADTRALLDVSSLVSACLHVTNNQPIPEDAIKAMLLLELVCSHGSLFERFNMHFNYKFDDRSNPIGTNPVSFDKIMDKFYRFIIDIAKDSPINFAQYGDVYVSPDEVSSSYGNLTHYVSARRFIELLRQGDWYIPDTEPWELAFAESFSDYYRPILLSGYDSSSIDELDPYKNFINIEPIISYQLACAQFVTNDFVDFIYSAKLYRENMQSIYDAGVYQLPFFLYNGVRYLYDIFSLRIFNNIINELSEDLNLDRAYPFFTNLLSYWPSLRYGDYFTGAKPRPLAVGEYSAQISSDNSVSAVDITRSIQMQRLLNRVNMVGRKLGDYLAGIFGGSLPDAEKDVPVFLAHQSFRIEGFETNNTGVDQLDGSVPNITTTNLRSVQDKYAYEIEIAEPCYLIAFNTYDVRRIYSKSIDRFAFHHDRYDDFIPEMQYIGDQEIYLKELDSSRQDSDSVEVPNFGYCLRFMEYKQRYSYASGGFIENLPSWAMITDNSDGNPAMNNINPDYIRSSSSEFDRFYKSLNGFSLGSYFHFIVAHNNMTSPFRQMEYTPEILK